LDILNRRLIFTMGKGGVGKSLVSAVLTRLALERGKRVLLVQINTRDRVANYLGCQPADEKIREVEPNLFSISIKPTAAIKEYVLMQVRLPIIYRLVFENRAVRYFLKAVPALNDLVVLGKIIYHLEECNPDGRPVYDLIIVDAPPTGHGLFLVGLPYVMTEAVSTGPIHREAANMLKLLTDPAVTAINLVTLPEEMPVSETLDMHRKLTTEYNMPIGLLVVNQALDPIFEEGDEQRLTALKDAKTPLADYAQIGLAALSRQRHAQTHEHDLAKKLPIETVRLPRVFSEHFGPEEVAKLADLMRETLGGGHAA
jgi:anion-transporting  ArsA/GET3 family ATPase